LEEHVASIFRVKEAKQETSVKHVTSRALLPTRFMLAYSSTMKMKVMSSSIDS
jgi:hypothetical protein